MTMREREKSSERLRWDALRKSINGVVNKVSAANIRKVVPELLSEDLIRGRGLFCRACIKSQMRGSGFSTPVFSALVSVVNTKFPEVGRLLLVRIVLQLRRAHKRNDKPRLLAAANFVAHLVNQRVAHEIIALELLALLLDNPTDDGVEVAVAFVRECGALLQDLSPEALRAILDRFRAEGEIVDRRVQFSIEHLFAIRRAKGFPAAIRAELDLVREEDQSTHQISLLQEEDDDPQTNLDVFKPNPQFQFLEDEQIKDETETNLINLRRTIYLTIMSSAGFEEAGNKLLEIKFQPGQEVELCMMILECCSQERTYLPFYGLLGQRFCLINKLHRNNFEECFIQKYSTIHRLETNKLRNISTFFAHLLATNALPWHVLSYVSLTEEDTTSSSRIFIKILFQELSEHLGIRRLNDRLNDSSFRSIFPKDNPKNTRFSINFFTSIGLGGITENLREYLKKMQQQQRPSTESSSSSDESKRCKRRRRQ